MKNKSIGALVGAVVGLALAGGTGLVGFLGEIAGVGIFGLLGAVLGWLSVGKFSGKLKS